jgi:NPCBM/NEW2 domain-containing protein
MNTSTIAASIVLATAFSSATALASADAATSHHPSAAAAPTSTARAYQVTAKVDETEPLLDTKVKIKATVSPAAPGSTVTLQVRYEDQKRWKTIATGRLSNASKYTFKDEVGSVRERKYRVVKTASAGRAAGHSAALKVTVFSWRTLDSIPPLPGATIYASGSAAMNATTYAHSLKGTLSPGRVEYNLNRDCKQLDAVYGIDDSSQLGASAVLSVLADGTQTFSGSFSLTQAQHAITDVTGVFRLAITSSQSGGGVPAVGMPQVLCSF